MQENLATTGEPDDLPETFCVNGEGLPGKVFSLRQKLYRKAKRQPSFRFYALYDADLSSYFDTIPQDKLMKCLQKRVSDRSVLHLIRMWLSAVVVEEGEGPGDPPKYSHPQQGTPQGGVISPLLANLYLHWFDYKFHRADGPYHWANARLVRYADDFVILAKYVGERIKRFVTQTLQEWMELKVNPEKTRTVNLQQPGAGLNFLVGVPNAIHRVGGPRYSFRYDRDGYGRDGYYLNLTVSEKSLQRVRDKLKEMTNASQCFTPVRDLIERVNRMLRGWQTYFSQGYACQVYRDVDSYTLRRLWTHLHRRSQRGYRKPKDVTWWVYLQHLGWSPLQKQRSGPSRRESSAMNDP